MAEATFKRKLSAILGAEVVGQLRLMGEYDVGTLHALKSFDAENIGNLKDGFSITHHGSIIEIERRLL